MIPLLRSPERLTAFGEDADAVDTAMDLLADGRRRAALQYLAETGGDATLTELAVEIAAQEAGVEPNAISDHSDVSSRERRAVRISLHHTHIPKLTTAEVVDYDTETETITLTDHGRTLLERADAVQVSA
ncbi:hypothetical protein NP511_00850 [Natrinema thermotolerans]|uniref:DUF7344 domain-containing protein n=1 Tax=Natrinema thermotolerans TaxID=121872 RepID=A0AAF0P9N9_9EURY|nr:hypothetical protein [Natrinema thermotolerans]QCC60529.1 hypothetical protein DVR14_18565 [Natrinema thermotolerans]QCC61425.1 hypothetical protein DVR14_22700 [Natrinema thermotolerans]WMT07567.1 hypothetical protein NP511_19565 [Natrinema thermotolerans]WMT08199.1 hypothetical protein NP511_00850 [Natrinema thermotolerans]